MAAAQDWVVSTAQLEACGVTRAVVRHRVEAGRWSRVRRGVVLLDPDRATTHGAWIAARGVSLVCPEAVLSGRTAAGVWGLPALPDGPEEVVVSPGRPLRARPDLLARRLTIDDAEVTTVRGLRLTTPARTVLDLVLSCDRLGGLAVLDGALCSGRLRRDDLSLLERAARGRPGSGRARDLWRLADGRAESALESRVRLRAADAGMPPDELQLQVRDVDGAVVARADMAYRTRDGRWLLVEADGAVVHATPEAVHRDRVRANRLAAMGYVVVRFTWRDTVDPFVVPRTIRAAL